MDDAIVITGAVAGGTARVLSFPLSLREGETLRAVIANPERPGATITLQWSYADLLRSASVTAPSP